MDKRILVVDFEARELGALERALRSEGLAALPARDREEALASWRESPADAVLLAVDDRQRRHLELVRALRGAGGTVPILFFGAAEPGASVRAPSEALAHGGDYFFRLPCDLSYLAGRVRAWAERGAQRAAAEPAAQTPEATPEAPELEGFGYEQTGFSIHPLLQRLREPRRPTPAPMDEADWSWVAELDRSEVLDGFDFVPPAGEAGALDAPEASQSGVGSSELAALLGDGSDVELDLLDDIRIEEVEEEAPAATLARIPLSRPHEPILEGPPRDEEPRESAAPPFEPPAAPFEPAAAPYEPPAAPFEPAAAPYEPPAAPYEPPAAPFEPPAATFEPPAAPYEPPAAPYEPPAATFEPPAAPYEPPAAPFEPPAPEIRPAAPENRPAAPMNQPAAPGNQPPAPGNQPAARGSQPPAPVNPPARPAFESAAPVNPPARSAFESAAPVNPPARPAFESAAPGNPPARPAFESAAPVNPPARPAFESAAPVNPPARPAFESAAPGIPPVGPPIPLPGDAAAPEEEDQWEEDGTHHLGLLQSAPTARDEPRSFSFRPVGKDEASRIVTGLPRSGQPGLSEAAVDALRALLEGGEARRAPVPPPDELSAGLGWLADARDTSSGPEEAAPELEAESWEADERTQVFLDEDAPPPALVPDAVQPEAVQPGAVQPDAAQPDAAQPDAAQPDAPDAVRPDAAASPPPEDELRARRWRRRAIRLERAGPSAAAADSGGPTERFEQEAFAAPETTEDIPAPQSSPSDGTELPRDGLTRDALTRDALTRDAPTRDAPTHDAPTRDAPTRGPTRGEPTREEPTRGEPTRGEPALAARPSAPIGDDEETQELFAQPLLAASGGADFPPGALAIVHQAEEALGARGLAPACAGFALAAQIYLDHGMPDPARALFRRILELRPGDAHASARLAELDGTGRDEELVLELVDDGFDESPLSVIDDLFLDAAGGRDGEPALSSFFDDLGETLLARRGSRRPEPADIGRLQATDLSPSTGRLRGVADAVELFLRARAQRTTGVVDFGSKAGLLFAHGMPAGLVGSEAVPSFLRLTADIGRITESQARELVCAGFRSPRAAADKLVARGTIDADDARLLTARHLEERVVRALQHRGDWRFIPDTHGFATEDLVIREGELRDGLVDLLPRAATTAELRAALDLEGEIVQLVPGTEHYVSDIDAPLVDLLDGRRGLEESARLSGTPTNRALSWALVWLREGLAQRRPRPRPAPAVSPTRARRRELGAPTLADLPPLRPRSRGTAEWPHGFRIERETRASPGPSRTEASPRPAPRSDVATGPVKSAFGHPEALETTSSLHAPLEPDDAEPREAARMEELDADARLKALAERVRTCDYFGILEVDASAGKKAIDDAHRRMRSLVPRDVSAELEAMAREVLRSVDEARDVLMIPELRAAYEHHLER